MTDIDINKVLLQGAEEVDPQKLARREETAGWSRETAQSLAASEGIELGSDHWKVIEMLRQLYLERGLAPHARMLAGILNDEFQDEGGSKYLYTLFPGGPVAQGSRIAGVPAPHDAKDLSFGSAF